MSGQNLHSTFAGQSNAISLVLDDWVLTARRIQEQGEPD